MNREYHKWYSPSLGRDMELLLYGHGGTPMLVFPTSMGRFYEYEDRGMIGAISGRYDQGQVQAFCPDSVDSESWYNKCAHPADRVRRHMAYEAYIMNEVVPLIRTRNSSPGIVATGCSFGGYHAMDVALRHPGVFHSCLPMSGAFDIKQFMHGYYDQNCYFNNPCGLSAEHARSLVSGPLSLEPIRAGRGRLGHLPRRKRAHGRHHVPGGSSPPARHLGRAQKHDWPLWHRMAQAYFR